MMNTVPAPTGPLIEALDRRPVIGIIRGCPVEHIAAIASAAADAGIPALEVTLDSPDPFDSIAALVRALPGTVLGAGTVRTPEQVEMAAAAGARFIVSPVVTDTVMEACTDLRLAAIPGAATPTEITRALDLGAFAVKVFPALQLGGPGYLKAVAGPLGHPRLLPTGGVDAGNAAAFLASGAFALGVGGSVFRSDLLIGGDANGVGSLASELVEAIS